MTSVKSFALAMALAVAAYLMAGYTAIPCHTDSECAALFGDGSPDDYFDDEDQCDHD